MITNDLRKPAPFDPGTHAMAQDNNNYCTKHGERQLVINCGDCMKESSEKPIDILQSGKLMEKNLVKYFWGE